MEQFAWYKTKYKVPSEQKYLCTLKMLIQGMLVSVCVVVRPFAECREVSGSKSASEFDVQEYKIYLLLRVLVWLAFVCNDQQKLLYNSTVLPMLGLTYTSLWHNDSITLQSRVSTSYVITFLGPIIWWNVEANF